MRSEGHRRGCRSTAILTSRRHIDLLRVSSATCSH
ncbi:putative leader peptide [Candidatus Protofrankia californiensis]